MRAKEFLSESDRTVTINIPITITIPSGNGDPSVSAGPDPTNKEMPPQPVNVFPLQQELEMKKKQLGKNSKVLNQILDDNGAWSEGKESRPFDIAEDFEYLKTEFEQLSEASGDF
jgi:hypothetical protein